MKSPFPGMDPFIEGWDWRSFHAAFNGYVRTCLNGVLPQEFIARSEVDVVIRHDTGWERTRVADVTVTDEYGFALAGGVAVAEPQAAVFVTEFPEPDERRSHRVEIVDTRSEQVVTVLEVLSPENKRGGRHAGKRAEILESDETSLVEVDLLRAGRRPPTVDPLPPCDYAAFVYRAWQRPGVEVYPWRLLDRMPTIPVPLREGDADVPLDLQEVFDRTFEEGRYARALPYDRPCQPPLPGPAVEVLARWQTAAD